MGVINITPDSFSDGGRYNNPEDALRRAITLSEEGADIIDLGAESSRPGAKFLSVDEEWHRLEPVLRKIEAANLQAHISVDTNKPEIMRRIVDYGVSIVNDIRGGADRRTLEFLSRHSITYLAMHMHQNPDTMQIQPLYGVDAISEVEAFYRKTKQYLLDCGFKDENIWLDPGIGFGKDDKANLLLLKQSYSWVKQYQLVMGISRKSFLGRLLGIGNPQDRDPASKMLEYSFLAHNIKAIRTHEVKSLVIMRGLLAV